MKGFICASKLKTKLKNQLFTWFSTPGCAYHTIIFSSLDHCNSLFFYQSSKYRDGINRGQIEQTGYVYAHALPGHTGWNNLHNKNKHTTDKSLTSQHTYTTQNIPCSQNGWWKVINVLKLWSPSRIVNPAIFIIRLRMILDWSLCQMKLNLKQP